MYGGYGIAFDGAGSWNSDNNLARNVVIFSINNSSPSHSDNCKNNFLVLGERPIFDINGSFDVSEKKIWY